MLVAPVELRAAQVEIAERAAGGDVGERIRLAVAPGRSLELARELGDAARRSSAAGARSSPCSAGAPGACARARSPTAASQMPSASASQRLTAMRCRDGSGMRRLTGLTVSRYSTITRESNSVVPSSSTSTGILPSGLKSATALPGVPRRHLDQLRTRSSFRRARCAPCARTGLVERGDQLEHGGSERDAKRREV